MTSAQRSMNTPLTREVTTVAKPMERLSSKSPSSRKMAQTLQIAVPRLT